MGDFLFPTPTLPHSHTSIQYRVITSEYKQDPLEEPASQPGTIMLLGANDSGKSTLCARLANKALQAGQRVAVVDTDVGQSEIGPPTTLGYGFVESPIRVLHGIRPAGLYFVGVTTPAKNLGGVIEGSKRLVQEARREGATLVLVDTSGMVAGNLANMLKLRKISAIKPDYIIALQKTRELEPILERVPSDIRIIRLSVSEKARSKSPKYRAMRRQKRFEEYFRKASTINLPISMIQYRNRPFPVDPLSFEFRLRDLAVGLQDAQGNTLGIGILQRIHFNTGSVRVYTPVSDIEAVTAIELGQLRLAPNGVELGAVDLTF